MAAVAVFSLACGNTVQANSGEIPRSPQTAPIPLGKVRETTTDTVELRDAPFRTALEMLFNANRVDYSIDDSIRGFDATSSYMDKSMTDAMIYFFRASPIELSFSTPNKVWLVVRRNGIPKSTVAETLSPRYAENKNIVKSYRNARDVPRRVSGIIRHDVRRDGMETPVTEWYAILETTKGVTLLPEGGKPFDVPLAPLRKP